MIRKPSGVEQEDRLHAAVGTVIHSGPVIRAAGRNVQRAGRKLGLYYLCGVMGFGLLMSSTPFWFKLLLGGGGYWVFRTWKNRLAIKDATAQNEASRKSHDSDTVDVLGAVISTIL